MSEVRAAMEAHEPANGMTQWYVDEFVIDCDAEELWAVAAKAEAAAIKRAIAATYRQQAGWTSDSHAQQEFEDLAKAVEALDDDDICCPCCQEITCDTGCPLEPVRKAARETAGQVVRGEVIHDGTPSVATHLEKARPDTAVTVAMTTDEFAEFTRKHNVHWEPQ